MNINSGDIIVKKLFAELMDNRLFDVIKVYSEILSVEKQGRWQ